LTEIFSRRNFTIYAVLWALLIFFLSHSPNTDDDSGFLAQIIIWVASWLPFDLGGITGLDKLIHAVFYAIFAFFIFGSSRRYSVSLVLASLYGITDEFHQSFVYGRDSDVWDWVADTVGASLSLGSIWLFTKLFTRKNNILD